MDLIIGMGEYIITDNEDAVIKTYGLASCVAVTVYSSLKKVAGMIHIVLPAPLYDGDRNYPPGYFAETGIPLLINEICKQYCCSKEELQVQIYGGAESMTNLDVYHIGRRNIDTVKKTLWEIGLAVYKTDLRGKDSRSVSIEAKTGMVEVHRQPIIGASI